MARVKRGVVAKAKHKKVLKLARGYQGARSRVYRVAKQAVIKAQQYAYRDRRKKKIFFRSLWIQRINAASRLHGLSYSQFMHGLQLLNSALDRKQLAYLAAEDEAAFSVLAQQVKDALTNHTQQAV
ncbi:MAG: 50S ribosomal protein L20 [Legionellales bacterium]|jgi:large subunit ribosomal protein L20|nr:50S ribosomal protein L20 [Legionellales bacterium]|tara:strand:- start:998 stop:1375 length:378 start_codon:yes stop_codon:yes gene_type:complete